MRNYKLLKQVSVIQNNKEHYLYNWLNDIGVSIENRYIKHCKGKNITFSDDFLDEYIKFLTENNFFVDNKNLAEFYKNSFQEQIKKEDSHLFLILLPAGNACNFRCVYCYENHNDTARFKELHSDKILALIEQNKHKTLHIEYFGGEPLLNINWILSFQKRIAHIEHKASMTTNGFLLTKEKFKSLIDCNVKSFQITIDGLQKHHDRLRVKCGGGGTYETIMNNLRDISTLKDKFHISLRCNFNHNSSSKEDRELFFKNFNFIQKDFRFGLLFRPIGLYAAANDTVTQEHIDVHYSNKDDMQNIWETQAQEHGFLLADLALYTENAGFVCYASKRSTLTITPQMEILKCTVAIDKEYNKFGVLNDKPEINESKLKEWEEYIQLDKACQNCFFFFQCMGRSCVLKNYVNKSKQCPIQPRNEAFLVSKIRKQKSILKEEIKNAKNI